jgi:alpha-tubulin suppressor-like RCC1 family protein
VKILKLVGIITAVLGGLSAHTGTTAHAKASSATTIKVYTWGRHTGTKPRVVRGLEGTVIQAVTNDKSTFILNSAGTVYQVFGSSVTTVSFPSSEPIAFLADPGPAGTEIAVGQNGRAYGWGKNYDGDLCLPAGIIAQPELLPVPGPIGAVSGQGDHALYAQTNATLWACGGNGYGDLGNGSTQPSSDPVAVTGFATNEVVAVTTGWRDSGALLSNGQFWDWGFNKFGQLGDGTKTASYVPVQVPGSYSQVFIGGAYVNNGSVLATTSSGQVYGWGNDHYGQLCDGATNNEKSPELIKGVPAASEAVAGGTDGFILATTGDLYSCGQNIDGDLGTGGTGNVLKPTMILKHITSVDATSSISAAIKTKNS